MISLGGASRGRERPSSHDVAFYIPTIGAVLAEGAVPPTGGAETQVFLLARALAARGVKVCVCTFDIPGVRIPPARDGVQITLRQPYVRRDMVGKVREVLAVRRAIADADAEVVVTRIAGLYVGLIGLFAKLARRRFIYSSASFLDFDFAGLGFRRRDLALYRLGLRLASEIVVQTAEQAQLCQASLGRSPVVIKSLGESVPPRTGSPEAFLWIGRVDTNKRPLAFVDLARSLPDSPFWMVAVPSAREERLMDEVERAAAEVPNLVLLTPRPRNELVHLIDRAVAVVSTSEFEGMPNVFLEAWARGVPALALTYDPDGVIERHGLGEFAGGSRETFVTAASVLWRGRHEQEAVAARCRRYVAEEHSEDVVAAQWERALGLLSPVPAGSAEVIA